MSTWHTLSRVLVRRVPTSPLHGLLNRHRWLELFDSWLPVWVCTIRWRSVAHLSYAALINRVQLQGRPRVYPLETARPSQAIPVLGSWSSQRTSAALLPLVELTPPTTGTTLGRGEMFQAVSLTILLVSLWHWLKAALNTRPTTNYYCYHFASNLPAMNSSIPHVHYPGSQVIKCIALTPEWSRLKLTSWIGLESFLTCHSLTRTFLLLSQREREICHTAAATSTVSATISVGSHRIHSLSVNWSSSFGHFYWEFRGLSSYQFTRDRTGLRQGLERRT